jgi:hypothetical protein
LTGRLYEVASPPATGTYPGKGKWTGDKNPKETPPKHPQHDVNMTQAKKAGKAISKTAGEPEEEPDGDSQEEPPEEQPKEKPKKRKIPESVFNRLSW